MQGEAWRKRQQWIESVTGLREADAITEADRTLLFSEYDDMQRAVRERIEADAPEFGRRIRDDGREAAETWMRERVHALGVERGQRLRRVLSELSFADQLELDRRQ